MLSEAHAANDFWKHCNKRTCIKQFLLLPEYFQLYSIIILSLNICSIFSSRCFKSRLLQIYCMWKRVNVMTNMSRDIFCLVQSKHSKTINLDMDRYRYYDLVYHWTIGLAFYPYKSYRRFYIFFTQNQFIFSWLFLCCCRCIKIFLHDGRALKNWKKQKLSN